MYSLIYIINLNKIFKLFMQCFVIIKNVYICEICSIFVRSCFTGIKHEWQVNGLDDIKDRKTLAEKLGGSSVVTLEGKPLSD